MPESEPHSNSTQSQRLSVILALVVLHIRRIGARHHRRNTDDWSYDNGNPG